MSNFDLKIIDCESIDEITWQESINQGFSDIQSLLEYLNLSENDFSQEGHQLPKASIGARKKFPIKVPRHYAAKIQKSNPFDPLLLQVMPKAEEFNLSSSRFIQDPLHEAKYAPVPGLLHKYKGRVLIVTTGACAIHCRYCFRRHYPYEDQSMTSSYIDEMLNYIKSQEDVVEVILSGGDPLSLSDNRFLNLVEALEKIPTLKRIRVHSRLLSVLPQRITADFLKVIESCRLQFIFVTHINHANEIDDFLKSKIAKLKGIGCWVLNQSVLLKGVNDRVDQLVELSERLFDNGIMPYYLHALDPVEGAMHFEVDLSSAKKLYKQLLAELPGFLVPKLVQDIPGQLSKSPINI